MTTAEGEQERDVQRSGRGWPRGRVLWLVAVTLVGLLYFEPYWLIRPELSSDGGVYFSHAATLGLDLDLEYANEPATLHTKDGRGGGPVGAGVLAGPFVGAFGMLDRVRGHPIIRDHRDYLYSWSMFGFQVSTLFFFIVGVWLYWRAGRVLLPGLDPRLNFLFAFSTGVPFYVLRRFAMTHAFEFAACALGLYAGVELYRAVKTGLSQRTWLLLAGLSVLASLAIRVNNLNTMGLPAIAFMVLYAFDRASDRPARRDAWLALGKVVAATAVALVPIALFNQWFYGATFPSPREMYGFDMQGIGAATPTQMAAIVAGRLPQVATLVFGSELGVLWTNPIVVVGGVYLLLRGLRVLAVQRDPAALLAVLGGAAYYGFNIAIVLWWLTTGSSYGYRYLFPLIPLGVLGVYHAMAWLGEVEWAVARPRIRRGFVGAVIALCSVAVASQLFFGVRDELAPRPQTNVYGRFHSSSVNGYLTALPAQLLKPHTWVSLVAKRYAGLAVGPAVMGTSLRRHLPAGFAERYRRVYGSLPPDVFVQTFIFFVLWVVAAYAVVYDPRRHARRSAAVAAEPPRAQPLSTVES